MTKSLRRAAISICGLLQGAIGSYVLLLGYAFAFPESGPGSKDYVEDMSLVPFGVVMILFWLILMITVFLRLRKNKADLLSFVLFWVIGLAGCLIYVFFII
ncbi:MAG: hypothetical protein IJ225_12085 [Solobacterium sp.]|nr:hypothetical protein [Solobacterium sp.]